MMKKLITITAAFAFVGTATADDMAKKDAPKAPVAKDAKDAKPVAKVAAKPAPPKFEAPKPPAELTEMGKLMAGNWKCSGKAMMDPAAGMIEFKGMTIKSTLDLDKFWIKNEMTGQIGPMKMKGTEYITFDASAKKWQRVSVDNTGGWETNTSTDGKKWDGDMRMMGMSAKTKANVEIAAKEFKVTAEMSPDGKKWMTGFEMACKK